MRYYVIAHDGARYGPADVALLQQWASQGRVVATTILEEESSGQRVAASSVLSLPQQPPAAASPPSFKPPSPSWQSQPGTVSYGQTQFANTSGQGPTAVVPPEIRGWSWAAFLGNWIWSIAHNTWIGLISLVPYAGVIMCFVLGAKGNEWAWQNRRWDSVEHFRQVQSIWTRWMVAITLVGIVLGVILGVLAGVGAMESARSMPGGVSP